MVECKREALAQFMAEARSHQDDLVTWFASVDGDYLGAELGLTVSNDAKV